MNEVRLGTYLFFSSELGLCPIPNPLLFIHIDRGALILILAIALREWGGEIINVGTGTRGFPEFLAL